MSDVSVRQLAGVLDMPVEKLMVQLAEAGMTFAGPDQLVSSKEKMKLLGFLRRTHGKSDAQGADDGPRKITLSRKKVSEITVSSGSARGKTVNVEVRQKRTYVKRSADMQDAGESERQEAQRLLDVSENRRTEEEKMLRAGDKKRQQVELDRQAAQAELEAAQKRAEAEARELEESKKKAESKPEPEAKEAADTGKASEVKSVRAKPAPAADATPGRAKDPAVSRKHDDKPRGEVRAKDSGEQHRHKGNRGSHRMVDDVVVADVAATRYVRGELHLADGTAPRRGRKKPRAKISPSGQSSDKHSFSKPTAAVTHEVAVGDTIVIADLAQKLSTKAGALVKALMKMGVMATINEVIDHDTAVLLAEDLGHTVVRATDTSAESVLLTQTEVTGDALPRPPVVTIMGHVDHGKTSLLDYIRRTKVASGEAGGITQHIGAYHVTTEKGVITFLDTPGHAAFTSMRARGAQLTDIVVLVVAADDGVMPQTVEAIQHARAAKVPLIIAVNKMDKPGVDPDHVKQGLVQHEVVPEEWGGEVPFVQVSAKTGDGIDDLLDAISLQAEVMELAAVADCRASGVVVESSLDKGRGTVATLLVQQGTLNKGDFVVCGIEYGRVRAMFDETGKTADEAGPSIPVVILGLSGVPNAGDDFLVVKDERLAKDAAQARQAQRRDARLLKQVVRMEDVMSQLGGPQVDQNTLNLLIKADVQGSVEALRESLTNLTNDLVRVNVIVSGVGGITESDVTLAAASKAIVIGFNVRADTAARKVINDESLDVRYFSIIYDVIDQVKQVVTGLLGTEIKENVLGLAEVRDVFRSTKYGSVAGSMVTEGVVRKTKPIRVLRQNVVIFQGELESLRRFKDMVEEVKHGNECGIAVKGYNDVKVGDQIECYERVEVQRSL